ncbi:MAG: DUF4382 domain-containing protein [Nitritalea sp.]
MMRKLICSLAQVIRPLLYTLLAILLLGLYSCSSAEERTETLLNIFLTDAPGPFEQVFVEIEGVNLFFEGENTPMFVPYDGPTRLVNVSLLVGGRLGLLGREEVPAGQLERVELLFGEQQEVRLGEEEVLPLTFADENLRKLSLNVSARLLPTFAYDLVIDLDIFRSVFENTNGQLLFRPVARSFVTAETGKMSGAVRPGGTEVQVWAVNEKDTIATAVTLEEDAVTGDFTLFGLNGTYDLYFFPRDPLFAVDTLFNLTVLPGGELNLDPITLQQRNP